jgi:basic amino acid/polyamine antiporter, APA family
MKKKLGLLGAIGLGLGAILGTGVFVSLTIAADIAQSRIFMAIILAAITALCNGLSAAQLAAAYPVSGGAYAYAGKYLHPWAGFTAGWLFLWAKTASAATAAFGFARYGLAWFQADPAWERPIALMAVLVMTAIVAAGIQKSNWVNLAIVTLTLGSLASLIVIGNSLMGNSLMGNHSLANSVINGPIAHRAAIGFDFFPQSLASGVSMLQATALLFVAYTGYGRITTMTEEVVEPKRTIPIAVGVTLALTMLLYLGVAGVIVGYGSVGYGSVGYGSVAAGTTTDLPPLYGIATALPVQWLAPLVAVSAIAAMLGVLLNLILGLSRVLMAMGRQGDMPRSMAQLIPGQGSPTIAIWTMGLMIGLLVTIGNIKTTWSFSAFNVLVYYVLMNLAALRLPRADRLYSSGISALGLVSCASLAFWVEAPIWQLGLIMIAWGGVVKVLINAANNRTWR